LTSVEFEEPFYEPAEMADLAKASRFGGGETRFGALCCLQMIKRI